MFNTMRRTGVFRGNFVCMFRLVSGGFVHPSPFFALRLEAFEQDQAVTYHGEELRLNLVSTNRKNIPDASYILKRVPKFWAPAC